MADLFDFDSSVDLSERILQAYDRLGRATLFRTMRPDVCSHSLPPSPSRAATTAARVLKIANDC